MALLITPTLLNSFDWLNNCPQSWKDRAYTDIMNTLNREPWKPNRAVRMGIDFENKVYANANRPDLSSLSASKHFIKVCERVRGYNYQKRTKLVLNVDGEEYYCFGRLDCYSPKEIIDIKTTAKFGGDAKYLAGWQHKFYTALEEVYKFTYLVAEWENAELENFVIREVYEVPYVLDPDKIEDVIQEIKDHIRKFIDYVNFDDGMKEAYYTRYNKFDKRKV